MPPTVAMKRGSSASEGPFTEKTARPHRSTAGWKPTARTAEPTTSTDSSSAADRKAPSTRPARAQPAQHACGEQREQGARWSAVDRAVEPAASRQHRPAPCRQLAMVVIRRATPLAPARDCRRAWPADPGSECREHHQHDRQRQRHGLELLGLTRMSPCDIAGRPVKPRVVAKPSRTTFSSTSRWRSRDVRGQRACLTSGRCDLPKAEAPAPRQTTASDPAISPAPQACTGKGAERSHARYGEVGSATRRTSPWRWRAPPGGARHQPVDQRLENDEVHPAKAASRTCQMPALIARSGTCTENVALLVEVAGARGAGIVDPPPAQFL